MVASQNTLSKYFLNQVKLLYGKRQDYEPDVQLAFYDSQPQRIELKHLPQIKDHSKSLGSPPS